jgi:hypothetical protein
MKKLAKAMYGKSMMKKGGASKMKKYAPGGIVGDDPKKKDLKWTGLDLTNGKCRNNLVAGVLEPMEGKIK